MWSWAGMLMASLPCRTLASGPHGTIFRLSTSTELQNRNPKRTFSPPKDGWQKGWLFIDWFQQSSHEISWHCHLLHMADLAYMCSWPLGWSWGSFYITVPLQGTDWCSCLSRETSTALTARLQHSLKKSLTTRLEIVLPADLNSSPLKIQHMTSLLVMNKQDQQPNHIANSSHLGKQKRSQGGNLCLQGWEHNRALRKSISVSWYLLVGPVVKIPHSQWRDPGFDPCSGN